jgi:hypothetical protein
MSPEAHRLVVSGLFASAFALADLFSFVFFRDTNLYAMFAFPIGRIYTNVRNFLRNIQLNPNPNSPTDAPPYPQRPSGTQQHGFHHRLQFRGLFVLT